MKGIFFALSFVFCWVSVDRGRKLGEPFQERAGQLSAAVQGVAKAALRSAQQASKEQTQIGTAYVERCGRLCMPALDATFPTLMPER